MLDWITTTWHEYSVFYAKYAKLQWSHMTPIKYGVLLIGIGFFGWLLMKSSIKKC